MVEAYNPFLRLPENPNYHRRARHHDYCRPSRYLLTLGKNENTPLLSQVGGDIATPCVSLTDAGTCLQKAIEKWPEKYPQIGVEKYVIMPDHVHLCVDVRKYLPRALGRAVASLMGMATTNLQCGDYSFFESGFNDRIAYTDEKWQRQLAYIDDNPRRLLIKRLFPDLFRRRWRVTLGDWQYTAIGNILLLKNPDLTVVRYSHRFSDEKMAANKKEWERCLENNGVIVSPFIHPTENAMQKQAIDQGGAIIRICENGFAERFAPVGRDFELVAEGRLLLIGPTEHDTRKSVLTYTKAQSLNAVAERIAAADWLSGLGQFSSI